MTSSLASVFSTSQASAKNLCMTCSLSSLCLPISLDVEGVHLLETLVKSRKPLQKGEHLFREGDKFNSVYVVRSGSLKSYLITKNGEEQITNFHLPSEMLGLESLDLASYSFSCKALETTQVCELPFSLLDDLADQLPDLRQQLFSNLSKELRNDKQLLLLLSKKSSDQKLAAFLVNLSERFSRRGLSPYAFKLPMSRNEIGNYLGMAVETVSRSLTRFQASQLLEVQGKEITILDLPKLLAAVD